MIDEIHICNVALIREAYFAPHESLTVITGETGTGKTALLNAIKLLLGERSEANLIREGSEELKVEGRFFFDDDQEGVVVSRKVGNRGRSKVMIDGSIASVKELATRIGSHVDLCGQHEHQQLLRPEYQRQLIDAWAEDKIAMPLANYRSCLNKVGEFDQELDRLRTLDSADSVELDRARFALEQISAVNPQEGEYEQLRIKLPRLENAEMLVNESSAAQRSISGSDGALEKLDGAISSLEHVAKVDKDIEEQLCSVREAYFALEEVGRSLATYRDGIEYSSDELESIEERMAVLQGLMRGYGPRMEDVFELQDKIAAKLSEYEGRDELIAEVSAKRDKAEDQLRDAAEELKHVRSQVIPQFLDCVHAQLARLAMGSSKLTADLVDLPRDQWNQWGPHTCEIQYSAGEAMKPQRLNKIASGGELSRIMLALKVVLGSSDNVNTLIFDEIDAGIGGSTARSLADVLVDLAATHQVIVVTHLPQVAVCGNAHYVVTKQGNEHPETVLSMLSPEERIDEIARMLSGEVNEVSLAHAKEILEERKG